MNQETFESRYGAEWATFEHWLDTRAARRRRTPPESEPLAEHEVAHRYRTICQHLALARDRQYSPGLVERLNALVMRGHQFLYGAHPEAGPAILRFFTRDFPRSARAQWRAVLVAAALFFVPLVLVGGALERYPDFAHTLIGPAQLRAYQEMYDPANRKPGRREAQADAYMLGYYIWNNIRIGFQTFAGGLLFGAGAVFFLVVNGILIGATAGHLIQIGYGTTFLSFVAGHSALELTGIVLMGGAGLLLGAGLLFPGPHTRIAALRLKARAAVPLVYGAGALLTAAAFVEAFWSPITTIAPPLKYAVGIGLWLALAVYFVLAGRRDAA